MWLLDLIRVLAKEHESATGKPATFVELGGDWLAGIFRGEIEATTSMRIGTPPGPVTWENLTVQLAEGTGSPDTWIRVASEAA